MSYTLTTTKNEIKRETEKAILVGNQWLPKSQITLEETQETGAYGEDELHITMPVWLARKKSFYRYQKTSRNFARKLPWGQLMRICKANSKKYNESWFLIGRSGEAGNASYAAEFGQHDLLEITPDGKHIIHDAVPGQKHDIS